MIVASVSTDFELKLFLILFYCLVELLKALNGLIQSILLKLQLETICFVSNVSERFDRGCPYILSFVFGIVCECGCSHIWNGLEMK